MNPYQQFVNEFSRLLRHGKTLPLGGFEPLKPPAIPPDAPKALIFSPHPDDEVIIGGLALRLLRELKMNVINVAVTQGTNPARKAQRLRELKACCEYIGFGLLQTGETGLDGINVTTRAQQPQLWSKSAERITEIVTEHQPRVLFFPHADDWNSTHIGTHHLVMDAMARVDPSFECYTIETEFWGAMDTPNLMVESSEQDVSDLLTALTRHVGEVQRNPYHVRMPAWLIDNVRRGSELVGGQGGAAAGFQFATLYRLRRWRGGKLETILNKGRFLSQSDDPGTLFPGCD